MKAQEVLSSLSGTRCYATYDARVLFEESGLTWGNILLSGFMATQITKELEGQLIIYWQVTFSKWRPNQSVELRV